MLLTAAKITRRRLVVMMIGTSPWSKAEREQAMAGQIALVGRRVSAAPVADWPSGRAYLWAAFFVVRPRSIVLCDLGFRRLRQGIVSLEGNQVRDEGFPLVWLKI